MRSSAIISEPTSEQRYEAVLRLSEVLVECREPEELARILAEQLGQFLPFDYLDLLVFKENSAETEWHAWGKGHIALPMDLSLRELPGWHSYSTQEPIHIPDVTKAERFPHAKEWTEKVGVNIGSIIRVPLTTPHRRLGTFGIASEHPNTYPDEDVSFLRMIARVVAFAIDDGLNLRRAQTAQAELQRNHDQLQLLSNLSNQITSNLELRELLRAIAANIREVAQVDFVGVSLPDEASGKHKMYALDFPQGKGLTSCRVAESRGQSRCHESGNIES